MESLASARSEEKLRSPLGFCVVTQEERGPYKAERGLCLSFKTVPSPRNLYRPEHLLKGRRHLFSFFLQGCPLLFLQHLHENCINIYQFYLQGFLLHTGSITLEAAGHLLPPLSLFYRQSWLLFCAKMQLQEDQPSH